jgi:putative phosphoesterase
MKIGIMSDSHRREELNIDIVEHLVKEGVEYIIHAGDFGNEENIKHIVETGLEYVVVFGNNDYHLIDLANKYNIQKEPYYLELGGASIKLMHLPYYLTPDTDIVIYGHTHMFELDKKPDTLYLNPGEVCARNKPKSECAILEIHDTKYDVEYIYKEIGSDKFKVKKESFDR